MAASDSRGERVSAPWSGQRTWHVARWGVLGWAETLVKLVGIVLAIGAALRGGAWAFSSTHPLAHGLLLAITVGYVVAILDRWTDKEIVAMVFVLAMVLGHVAMAYASGRSDWPGVTLRLFAASMLAGDLLKLAWFAKTGARVRDLPRPVPFVMTGVLAALYVVVLVAA